MSANQRITDMHTTILDTAGVADYRSVIGYFTEQKVPITVGNRVPDRVGSGAEELMWQTYAVEVCACVGAAEIEQITTMLR
jgi:hypothetical protein